MEVLGLDEESPANKVNAAPKKKKQKKRRKGTENRPVANTRMGSAFQTTFNNCLLYIMPTEKHDLLVKLSSEKGIDAVFDGVLNLSWTKKP